MSNGIAFTVDNNRNIREIANEAALATALSDIDGNNQDDILYLRTGTYSDQTGDTGWGDDTINLGPAWEGIAVIGYPGDTVDFDGSGSGSGGIRSGNASGPTDNLTISSLNLDGGDYCYRPAGPTGTPDDNTRIINCDLTTSYTGNTMTGVVAGSGS